MEYQILCHYDEIALKGKNKDMFERALIRMIDLQAKRHSIDNTVTKIYKGQGRVHIDVQIDTEEIIEAWEKMLQNVFGIAYIGIARVTSADISTMIDLSNELLSTESFESFRVQTKRSNKTYPITSPEINRQVGAGIFQVTPKKVDLKHPDITVWIEIIAHKAYIYIHKSPGPGGLPVGTQGKAIILMSGGIDSPVAAYYAQKRGLSPIFVHFHSYPYTNDASIDKVKKLTAISGKYAKQAYLYLAPLADAQKKVVLFAPEKYRIIIYRRLMMRAANMLASRLGAKTIITGEALGQVASQTIENMTTVEAVSKRLILRPLIGFDKHEIIKKAKEIGTFDTSIIPHDDCCSLFTPKKPAIYTTIQELEEIEKDLPIEEMIQDIIDRTEKEQIL
ncbi:tRNA 4-thiouridine(8) synthase ThiI [Patescibacteria group bacterium]|nr:tRNA 4-thiouridine(8) synthase ThiI [Patescibacteria group bacterium]MBU1721602.1 tRNA 4-thiouridine(8) synthase ThiI [Patescibacteria group bacterium]MBU1901828.1 tRNA 4-thiouridine(8) synthase ThiI [Patescibacteria group bacterium]